jgi:hypothetical protein
MMMMLLAIKRLLLAQEAYQSHAPQGVDCVLEHSFLSREGRQLDYVPVLFVCCCMRNDDGPAEKRPGTTYDPAGGPNDAGWPCAITIWSFDVSIVVVLGAANVTTVLNTSMFMPTAIDHHGPLLLILLLFSSSTATAATAPARDDILPPTRKFPTIMVGFVE